MHSIQNTISELALKNSALEEENKLFEDEIKSKTETIKHYETKVTLL